jgi:hypothetical protein
VDRVATAGEAAVHAQPAAGRTATRLKLPLLWLLVVLLLQLLKLQMLLALAIAGRAAITAAGRAVVAVAGRAAFAAVVSARAQLMPVWQLMLLLLLGLLLL